jgi:hypothetical protein
MPLQGRGNQPHDPHDATDHSRTLAATISDALGGGDGIGGARGLWRVEGRTDRDHRADCRTGDTDDPARDRNDCTDNATSASDDRHRDDQRAGDRIRDHCPDTNGD